MAKLYNDYPREHIEKARDASLDYQQKISQLASSLNVTQTDNEDFLSACSASRNPSTESPANNIRSTIIDANKTLTDLLNSDTYKQAALRSQSEGMALVTQALDNLYTKSTKSLDEAHALELKNVEANTKTFQKTHGATAVTDESLKKIKTLLEERQLTEKKALIEAINQVGNNLNDFYDWDNALKREANRLGIRAYQLKEGYNDQTWADDKDVKHRQVRESIDDIKNFPFTATARWSWRPWKPLSSIDTSGHTQHAKIEFDNNSFKENPDGTYNVKGKINFPKGAASWQKEDMAEKALLRLAAASSPKDPNQPALKTIDLNDYAVTFGSESALHLAYKLKQVNPDLKLTPTYLEMKMEKTFSPYNKTNQPDLTPDEIQAKNQAHALTLRNIQARKSGLCEHTSLDKLKKDPAYIDKAHYNPNLKYQAKPLPKPSPSQNDNAVKLTPKDKGNTDNHNLLKNAGPHHNALHRVSASAGDINDLNITNTNKP
jgi:hypothetical protein